MFVKRPATDGYTSLDEISQACYELQEGSSCIDTGDDNYAAISRFDLAGKNRVYGSHVDRGAFEFDGNATGIKSMNQEQKKGNNIYYNVAGQRIARMQKGIIIVNGEKIIGNESVKR